MNIPSASGRGRQHRVVLGERASQRLSPAGVAAAHPPQVALELAARDEVRQRQLPRDLRAGVLDRLGGDERP